LFGQQSGGFGSLCNFGDKVHDALIEILSSGWNGPWRRVASNSVNKEHHVPTTRPPLETTQECSFHAWAPAL
jgi:hypothetical protein